MLFKKKRSAELEALKKIVEKQSKEIKALRKDADDDIVVASNDVKAQLDAYKKKLTSLCSRNLDYAFLESLLSNHTDKVIELKLNDGTIMRILPKVNVVDHSSDTILSLANI